MAVIDTGKGRRGKKIYRTNSAGEGNKVRVLPSGTNAKEDSMKRYMKRTSTGGNPRVSTYPSTTGRKTIIRTGGGF